MTLSKLTMLALIVLLVLSSPAIADDLNQAIRRRDERIQELRAEVERLRQICIEHGIDPDESKEKIENGAIDRIIYRNTERSRDWLDRIYNRFGAEFMAVGGEVVHKEDHDAMPETMSRSIEVKPEGKIFHIPLSYSILIPSAQGGTGRAGVTQIDRRYIDPAGMASRESDFTHVSWKVKEALPNGDVLASLQSRTIHLTDLDDELAEGQPVGGLLVESLGTYEGHPSFKVIGTVAQVTKAQFAQALKDGLILYTERDDRKVPIP